MPPRFRTCPLCKQGFGTASLNIHIPQCYEKAIKRWRLNPIGPMPVMPSLNPEPYQGGKHLMTESACGNGVIGARSLRQQSNINDIPDYSGDNANLHPCSHCGRKFLFDRIAYHESVCKGTMKRKVFDSSKQRAVENDGGIDSFKMSYSKKKKNMKHTSGGSQISSGIPRTHWREQHREFIEAMRAARRARNSSQAMWGEPTVKAPAAYPVNQQRLPPAVARHQKGMRMREQRTREPIETSIPRAQPVMRQTPARRTYGSAFGGGGERFSGYGSAGGGKPKIINDNTTSLGMLQAFGRA
ncbi:uncharacterized protein TM35_000024890 [Trypanosoma theileri]|uniref:C2HC/C3H-type domain-containing protein n=1 Tax=Trypanosoma theileri TaxID=67003 RepID=A0A1X0P958_9TRYP|nr:uncharacterized protein TM35_000024890 [Trypanosoma theileri]ORC93163.1 hypothetical protein TM35_000024890 [Trypanosoma theileri]